MWYQIKHTLYMAKNPNGTFTSKSVYGLIQETGYTNGDWFRVQHYTNGDWFRVQHNGMSPRGIIVNPEPQAAGNNDPEG